jgi:hypothetical protein
MTRTVSQSWSRLWKAVAAISLLFSSGALAQTAYDANRMPGGGAPSARVQSAHAEWRKLSQNEVNCVDQSLRAQRSNLWHLIQRGINPSDPTIARLRAPCRTPKASNHSTIVQSASQAMAAAPVDGVGAAAADKAAADQATADKAAADKAAANKAAANKVAPDKAAADKAAADKAAAEKAAADKAAADKSAADKAAADKVAAEKAAAEKAAADKATADKAAIDLAKADAARAKTEAIKPQADAEPPRKEADAAFAHAAAESRTSFIYGLISGPILFGLGGLAFLFMPRKRSITGARSDAVASDKVGGENQLEFDRLVTAVLAEQKRRNRKQPEPIASEREQRIGEAAIH